jgi:PAS domain S-box-containing protein
MGTFGISMDITKRKQAEAELAREKQYFESLIVHSPIAIVVLDNDEKVVSINPAFEKLYDYSREEVIGIKIDTLVTTTEMAEEAKSYTQQSMAGKVHAISKRRRKDGLLVDVEIFIMTSRSLSALARRPNTPTASRANSWRI